MTESHPPAERDGRGRFVPGCSGNPAGKRPGTRNRATQLKELLRDGDAEAAGRAIIARAVGGDAVAGRFLFERLDPKPRGRPVVLARGAGTLAERFAAVFAAVAAGDITPDEALALGRLLELERKAVGAGHAASATVSPLTAAQREAAALAELAAVFGDPAGVVPGEAPPEPPAEPTESLHSTCISRSPPPGAGPQPVPAASSGAIRRRAVFRPGAARERAGMSAPPTVAPS